ncbi:MAG: 6-pyruvoyl trahydropterin synthase family protein, partial [Pseudonocardiaceae bacterium]
MCWASSAADHANHVWLVCQAPGTRPEELVYLIAQQFAFSASHRLDGLDPGHPCSRDHGHNYTVRVALAADELD